MFFPIVEAPNDHKNEAKKRASLPDQWGWEVLRCEVHEETRDHQAEAGGSYQQREALDGTVPSAALVFLLFFWFGCFFLRFF